MSLTNILLNLSNEAKGKKHDKNRTFKNCFLRFLK